MLRKNEPGVRSLKDFRNQVSNDCVLRKVEPNVQNLKDLTKKPRKWVSIDSVSKKVEAGLRNQMV